MDDTKKAKIILDDHIKDEKKDQMDDTKKARMVASLGYLKAREGGLIDQNISTEQSGVLGSSFVDIAKTTTKYVTNQISKKEFVKETKGIIENTVRSFVSAGYEAVKRGAVAVVSSIPVVGPIVGKVVDTALTNVKETVVSSITKAVSSGIEAVTGFVGKIFGSIFG